MKRSLHTLIDGLQLEVVAGRPESVTVANITFDSRRVVPGSLFVAIPGTRVDGHDFIGRAASAGAVAVITEKEYAPEQQAENEPVILRATNSAVMLGELADRWYGAPSRQLKLVGVTGTNGKTTVTTLLYDLFTRLGYRAGLLSTVEIRIAGEVRPATHTTPDALAIQATLSEMRDARVDFVFMEVSSHAVHQHRIAGLHFAGGVFTNLSHDHLDYHGTFANYLAAKKAFFDDLPERAFALSNADDRRGAVMLQNCPARAYYYSLRSVVDFHARLVSNTPDGLQLHLNGTDVFFQMVGRFNAYNLLATYGAAILLGQREEEVLIQLSGLKGAAGRLELVADPRNRRAYLVDYAHTPDALQNVLDTLRDMIPSDQQLLCVIGAGGDRDRGKRPQMAAIAARIADRVILTTDNPRSENPDAILDELEAGVPERYTNRVLRITDRREAIAAAVSADFAVTLVAGKGHETYQEVKGRRLPFDDREEILKALNPVNRAY
jgi:UDP-N-acetylmuramoyl-L-alanyl-D-glutamate--2,6-diaminopimelate ligase